MIESRIEQQRRIPVKYGEPTEREIERFNWHFDLTDNAKQLYELLDVGDTETCLLSEFAEMEGFDLEAAKEELRMWGMLDESDPGYLKFTVMWKEPSVGVKHLL